MRRLLAFQGDEWPSQYTYQGILPDSFLTFLKGLTAEDIWVDAGAGQAVAMMDYASNPQLSGRAKLVAINATDPYRASSKPALFLNPKRFERFRQEQKEHFTYLAGSPIEKLNLDRYVGRVGLITDVVGPLSYSEQPSKVLQIYVNLLRKGGRLYVRLGDLAVRSGDQIMPLSVWLAGLRGLKVTRVPDDPSGFVVERLGDEPIEIPVLKKKTFMPTAPPTSEFEAPRS